MVNTVPGARFVASDEMLVFETTAKSSTRRVVVKRDDDLLTPHQVQEHWKDVQEARLKEPASVLLPTPLGPAMPTK